jgi:hypothetical protein
MKFEDDAADYNIRDSVTSIKDDDPFFRNYQTPQSVGITRELSSAKYSSYNEGFMDESASRSARSNMDTPVNLPVRATSE